MKLPLNVREEPDAAAAFDGPHDGFPERSPDHATIAALDVEGVEGTVRKVSYCRT